MTVKVTVESRIGRNVSKAIDMYEENTARHLNRVANEFRNQITKAMQSSKGGRTYVVTKSGKTHTASVKGNPPAINTGRLVNSFFVKPATRTRNFSSIETKVKYAGYLEDEQGLDRPFMSERSVPFKNTKQYANKMSKDIKLNRAKITWAFILLMYKQYYTQP